jgi:hypothetical protein
MFSKANKRNELIYLILIRLIELIYSEISTLFPNKDYILMELELS